MNKKGVIFTITAILFLGILVFAILLQERRTSVEQTSITAVKVNAMNEFVKSIDDDLQRGLYITSFRGLLGIQQFVATRGVYLQNVDAAVAEVILNGSVEGSMLAIMNDSTFTNWTSRVVTEAADVGLIVNITLSSLSVYQTDPWVITIDSNVDIDLTDTGDTATWSVSRNILSKIPIVGLEDPLFTIETNGLVVRTINNTPFEGNYADGLNTSNLITHITEGFYAESTGPSFLMRLEGNFSNATAGGIESIVDIPDLQSKGMTPFENSSIDYEYFGTIPLTVNAVNNTFESWFRLDPGSLAKYQVENITI